MHSLRRVEQRAHPEKNPPQRMSPVAAHELQSLLESVCEGHRRLWLRFSDEAGHPQTHLIEPLSYSAGEICAFDVTSNEIRIIPVSRVVAAAGGGADT